MVSLQFRVLLKRLTRWFLRSAGIKFKPTATSIFVDRTNLATLHKVDSGQPGVIATWSICHQYSDRDLILSMISLRQLREDLATKHAYARATDPLRIKARTFSEDLNKFLQAHGGLEARLTTHIFVVVWRGKVAIGSNERRFYTVTPVCSIPGDLAGGTFGWQPENRVALKIAEVLAKKMLRVSHTSTAHWHSRIDGVDWLEQLEAAAQRALGTEHVLQPRKKQI